MFSVRTENMMAATGVKLKNEFSSRNREKKREYAFSLIVLISRTIMQVTVAVSERQP